MTTSSEFVSALAPVITRYLDLKTILGRDYAKERRVFQLLDTFLATAHPTDLTAEGFERWCLTQAHLKSGLQRAQMPMVRNLCVYRRRTAPDCFVPDPAFFPLCHQHARPSLLSEDEIARLMAATSSLFPTAASPLRSLTIRLSVV